MILLSDNTNQRDEVKTLSTEILTGMKELIKYHLANNNIEETAYLMTAEKLVKDVKRRDK